MPNPMIRIHDLAIGEMIDREMTDAEFAKLEEENAKRDEIAAKEAEAQAKREAALSKLAALGLTADDLKALGL